jgi:hypothetical protein
VRSQTELGNEVKRLSVEPLTPGSSPAREEGNKSFAAMRIVRRLTELLTKSLGIAKH